MARTPAGPSWSNAGHTEAPEISAAPQRPRRHLQADLDLGTHEPPAPGCCCASPIREPHAPFMPSAYSWAAQAFQDLGITIHLVGHTKPGRGCSPPRNGSTGNHGPAGIQYHG